MSKRKVSDLPVPVFGFEKSTTLNPSDTIPNPPVFPSSFGASSSGFGTKPIRGISFGTKPTPSNAFSSSPSPIRAIPLVRPMPSTFNPLSNPYTADESSKTSSDTVSSSSQPNKKIKTSHGLNGIIIKPVHLEKSEEQSTLIYSFKMHYKFDQIRYITNRIINISISELDTNDHLIDYVLFSDIKRFIKKLNKNQSCTIRLDNYLTITYNKDTSEWIHNIRPVDAADRITIRIPMNKELLGHFANTLKEDVVDKIAGYMAQ